MPGTFIAAAGPNFMSGRLGRQVSLIVLHTTVGTMQATLATFQNPNRIASAHYVVGLDGQVVNMVSESDTAYHSGNWETNLSSIGIEHVDDGDYNGPRTPELYAASSALVADLCARYGIPQDRAHIRKHSEVSDNPTACPDALDVDRIVAGSAEGDDVTPQGKKALVILAYLAAGGRTPETQAVIDDWASKIHDNGDNTDQIIANLVNSPEFLAYRTKAAARLAAGAGAVGPKGDKGDPGKDGVSPTLGTIAGPIKVTLS